MPFHSSNPPERLNCPIRGKIISSMICHTCPNHIKVMFKSELSPELQCSRWNWGDLEKDCEFDRDTL